MSKKSLYYFNLLLIFIILLAVFILPTSVWAQTGAVSGFPYDVQRFYYSTNDGRLYGDLRGHTNYNNLPYSQADAAWNRQWGPIQEITGISSGEARSFIQKFKGYFKSEMTKVFANTEDWGVIVGTSGVLDTFGDVSSDFFQLVTNRTAQLVTGRDDPQYQYVPENWGYQSFFYPPEGLNYPHAFRP